MVDEKQKGIKPSLIIDKLSDKFGSAVKNRKKRDSQIAEDEKILLTLIAQIIVDIIIKEEL
ncbi:hypothetical protein PQ469_12210 [Mucilaginibacter sp. KACC 22773]|uniref:hypothetical protein n=1 Tax=Mucilaginibacter sp. KACC 22773 TaxID=3025671 RepID=UPI0023667171|nr:hypothetical protein [Mucilaginibacter sp. KACC 22773]WDF80771.1 hypothetical protein PQ469_12210 [Mucilaginibacter sp. KACC 22773]